MLEVFGYVGWDDWCGECLWVGFVFYGVVVVYVCEIGGREICMKCIVLFIEDNVVNWYLVCFILEKNGFEVVEVDNGVDGVWLVWEWMLDLVLMDIEMFEMDGYEVVSLF